MIKKGEIFQTKIEKFALGGHGLVRVDGVPVFIDDVCIGDLAEVRLVKKKKSFGEGRVMNIVELSDERSTSRCMHFGVCGGCSWQFLSYEKQLVWKEQLVHETMKHLGGFSEEVLGRLFRGAIGCDEPWFYRNKMEWSFSVDTDGKLSGGFHRKRMHYDTVNVKECFLQSEVSVKIFEVIRDFFAAMHDRGVAVVYDSKRRQGFLRSAFVREGKRTGEFMVIVQTSEVSTDIFDVATFVRLFQPFPEIVSVVQIIVHDEPGRPKRFEERLLHGKNHYREHMEIAYGDTISDVLRLSFQVQPLAFFQPNTLMAERMYGEIAGLLCEHFSNAELESMRALDLYCGTGTISIILSHFVNEVVGVELNDNAISSARENAMLNNRTNISFHLGDAKHVLHDFADTSFGVMTIDPPRSGIEMKALEHIIRSGSRAIIYISCNPATFARDAKVLCSQGYELTSLRVFDQFPQTAHVETVASLKKME